ncbi:V-type proton ATPase subunit D 1 [Sphaeroforma arctica JP610]|uniref:V-type proton ATPase subunit n=1 Tax=Sphaeroforma arctica JP610 TaxID=667725 RepID=A0A0L0G5D5_9EUKA|nr:V-type proton ATPase subunit D 1 [Sphaeroforma arctica JP610]KNC84252.1 V-type proton ATPase subunit D 1 [Sphaeroforma arctica JP610]|eukprot:XP_014158154.1 V-type proton ATPase subunit D 1 [Sphaeroforma arctica JP610]
MYLFSSNDTWLPQIVFLSTWPIHNVFVHSDLFIPRHATSHHATLDLKLHLASTHYGSFLSDESGALTVPVIQEKLQEKFLQMFEIMRAQVVEPANTFFDYITFSYMIDNIILLITGTLHDRDISELIPKCHPLGKFEEMGSLSIATTPAELYNSVLVDTPLANYFQSCIDEQDLDEMNIEIIRNSLYKAYLEDFYKFSTSLGNDTAELMQELLAFEADRRAFVITINSFDTELTRDDRQKLYPRCGRLYPEGLQKLAACDDYEQVRAVAEYYPEYRELFDGITPGSGKTLEDMFYEYEVHLCKKAFLTHFSFASYYSLCKLREQESRNIVWIAECISQKHKAKIDNYVPIF